MPSSSDGRSVVAFIALGSNLGDRRRTIESAFEALEKLPKTELMARSSIFETAPEGPGVSLDKPFFNAAAKIETSLSPHDLMDALLAIEAEFGRVRSGDSKDRTLDLDIILYGDLIHTDDRLIVPHPRFASRVFVLAPLVELAGDLIPPGFETTVARLLDEARKA